MSPAKYSLIEAGFAQAEIPTLIIEPSGRIGDPESGYPLRSSVVQHVVSSVLLPMLAKRRMKTTMMSGSCTKNDSRV